MNSLLPAYYQIKRNIKDRIINREYGSGAKIESENDLAQRFNVCRLTVRHAIGQLCEEGLLYRKRGKGTFVTQNEGLINEFDSELAGFIDDLFSEVSRSKTQYMKLEKMTASRYVGEKLRLQGEKQEVVKIQRVRYMRERAFAFTVNFLPLEIGEAIREEELYKKSLLQIMEQDLGIRLTEAFQTIEASFADDETARRLGMARGLPVLYVERTMYSENRRPVEFVQSSYRGDRYKYTVRLKHFGKKKGDFWMPQPINAA